MPAAMSDEPGIDVASGCPFHSSKAWAATPTASANTSRVAISRCTLEWSANPAPTRT